MKKALVIGGYGNIGLGVTKKLLNEGYDVTVLTAKERTENPVPEAKCIIVDRKNEEAFRARVKDEYDCVIDLACMTKENAQQDYEVFRSLEHIVVASSGAAYGALHGSELPIRESMKLDPVWEYGRIKKEMENFFQQKVLEENYPVTIFRPTVTYGRQKRIVRQIGSDNSWIDRIRKGKPIVTGNPYILRNFLHVDDAAAAFTGALKHAHCKGQTYNLVGLKPYDWGEYHTAMMKVLGREVETVEVPLSVLESSPDFQVSEMIRYNFVYNGYYSGEKIARDIPEFRPEIDLETGLGMQVEWLERHNLIDNSDALTWEDELIRAQKKALF